LVIDGELAFPLLLQPLGDGLFRLFVVQAVDRDLFVGRVDVWPVADVRFFLDVAPLHDLADR